DLVTDLAGGGASLDDESLRGLQAGEVDDLAPTDGCPETVLRSEHHIGFAGVGCAVVAIAGADNHVVEAVTVHVTGRRDPTARLVANSVTLDHETLRRSERCEVDHLAPTDQRAEATGTAEDHVGRAAIGKTDFWRTDQQVVIAIAVHIAGRRYRTSHIIVV